jgi:hypothetical protein
MVWRKVLNYVISEFKTSRILGTLIELCLKKTDAKVLVSKCLSDAFLIENVLKQGNMLLLAVLLLLFTVRKV